MSTPVETPMVTDCQVIVDCVRKMRAHGVSEDHYRELHHLTPPRGNTHVTYASTEEYFSEPKELRLRNRLLAERLAYFVSQLEVGITDHRQLIKEALLRVPMQ